MKPENRMHSAQEPGLPGDVDTPGPQLPRGRGRPILMSTTAVLERIRQLAGRREGLFRVHRTHAGLYARARRQFGSWAAAVAAAGLDYETSLGAARRRSIEGRRRRRRRRTPTIVDASPPIAGSRD